MITPGVVDVDDDVPLDGIRRDQGVHVNPHVSSLSTAVSAAAPARMSESVADSCGECDTPSGLRTNSMAEGTNGARIPAS